MRAAFDLKHAKAIGAAKHVVDRRVLGREAIKRHRMAQMLADQVEGLADTGQHPEGQHVDLEYAQRVDVVLVPADHGAPVHRGVFNRDQFVEAALGDDKAAHVLA